MLKPLSTSIFFTLLVAIRHIATTVAAVEVAAEGGEHVIELYMHDILGGSSPTARPVTGLLGNIYSGQVPFARPVGFLPPKGGVAIPMPMALFQPPATQLGPDGLGLGFGTITVIDDVLTSGPDLGSQQMGKAQGVYVASSVDGATQMMTFTAMIEGGEYGDSINFFGVYKIGSTMSRLSVTGGQASLRMLVGLQR
ncbi:Dirigent protein 18 [Vitis vinifera]|uniref:Dirigent protein n=1 Tax=Vitis vinifera TaxID=29760 RepID=A0A438BRI6_VITVI|nr:Dirigent protein 18 [Vitis vinifera]